MKRIVWNFTEELVAVLASLAKRTGEKQGPLAERLLRDNQELENERKRLKVKFVARTEPGKRAKKQKGDK